MRFILIIFFICQLFFISISAENKGVLTEVLNPSMIDIYKNKLFVMDIDKIHIYSLKDQKHIKTFGRKGEGPGEYQIVVQMPMRLFAQKDYLLVESINKILFFDHDGNYIKEIKKLPLINLFQPAGENFVARRIIQPQDGSLSISSVRIYDSKMKEIKELFKQNFVQQGAFPKLRIDLGKDFLLFCIYKDLIFLEKSSIGPFIDVYNKDGKKLYTIKIPYNKIKINSAYKKDTINNLSKDPQVVRQLKQFNFEWKDFSKNFKYDFPEYFPSVQTMNIDDEKIYIKTFEKKGELNKYIIMDLKGKVLKTIFIKPTAKNWIMSTMMGINLEIIRNGKIYYVLENDENEWELHVQNIK